MKELEEIYQEMLDCFAQRTGLEAAESCDLAVRFYAVAAQVYALYAQADWVLRQCFPQTAAGSCLDSHAQLRGLSRKQATAAEGSIRFSVARAADTDRPIPAGTVCMTPGMIRFETAQAAVLEAGASWVDVPARALMPGSAGNVPAGAVTAMAAAPVGIAACTNPAPFAGGGDEEGDEGLRQRVLSTFRRLPNGANAAFYEQGALSFDQVAAASVLPRSRGRGTVDVVAATLEGMPDEELLGQLGQLAQRELRVLQPQPGCLPQLFRQGFQPHPPVQPTDGLNLVLGRVHRLLQIGHIAVGPAVDAVAQILFHLGVHDLHGGQRRPQGGQKIGNGLAALQVCYII